MNSFTQKDLSPIINEITNPRIIGSNSSLYNQTYYNPREKIENI